MTKAVTKRNGTAVININEQAKKIRSTFIASLDGFVETGKMIADAIDADPRNLDKLKELCGDIIPETLWTKLEHIGRGWLHAKCLFPGGAKNANKIARLPYNDQKRVFDGERVEMLTVDGEVMNVKITEVEPDQADQLINRNHIRNLSEQKAYIENRKASEAFKKAEPLPYHISNGKVSFRRDTVLDVAQWQAIVKEIKKSMKVS